MIKKTVALSLAAVFMIFALAACGKKTIVGKWKVTVNVADQLASEIGDIGIDIGDDLSIDLNMDFNEDGTYSMKLDEESADEFVDKVLDIMVEALGDTLGGISKEDLSSYINKDDIIDSMNLEDSGKYTDDGSKLTLENDDGEGTIEYKLDGDKLEVDLIIDEDSSETLHGTGTRIG